MATVPSAALFGFAGMQAASPVEAKVSVSAPLQPADSQQAMSDPFPQRPPEAKPKAVEASYYGSEFAGRPTASGERFDPSRLTAAHRSLPFGTIVKVINAATGKSVDVQINDRGPFHGNREIDLSMAAAKKIGMDRFGTAKVMLEVISSR